MRKIYITLIAMALLFSGVFAESHFIEAEDIPYSQGTVWAWGTTTPDGRYAYSGQEQLCEQWLTTPVGQYYNTRYCQYADYHPYYKRICNLVKNALTNCGQNPDQPAKYKFSGLNPSSEYTLSIAHYDTRMNENYFVDVYVCTQGTRASPGSCSWREIGKAEDGPTSYVSESNSFSIYPSYIPNGVLTFRIRLEDEEHSTVTLWPRMSHLEIDWMEVSN